MVATENRFVDERDGGLTSPTYWLGFLPMKFDDITDPIERRLADGLTSLPRSPDNWIGRRPPTRVCRRPRPTFCASLPVARRATYRRSAHIRGSQATASDAVSTLETNR